MSVECKEITVSTGITISVGKFESIRLDASARITDDNGDYDTMFDAGWNLVEEQINKKIEELQDVMNNTSVFKLEEKPKPPLKKKVVKKKR